MLGRKRINMSIIMALLLLISIGVTFVFSSKRILKATQEASFNTLEDTAEKYVVELKQEFESNWMVLHAISENLKSYNLADSQALADFMRPFEKNYNFSEIGVLFPNGRYVLTDGTVSNHTTAEDFKIAAENEEIVADTFVNRKTKSKELVQTAPVVKNGETIAVICATIDLASLDERYTQKVNAKSVILALYEKGSKNPIIDTLHSGEAQPFSERNIKKGFEKATTEEGVDVIRTAFFSQSYNEYIYCVIQRAEIGDWVLLVGTPESRVFGESIVVTRELLQFAIIEALLFLAYIIWVLITARKDAIKREERIKRTRYILDIEETLFNVPNDNDLMNNALNKISEVLEAKYVFLDIHPTPYNERQVWRCVRDDLTMDNDTVDTETAIDAISEKTKVVVFGFGEEHGVTKPEIEKLKNAGIMSVMAVPIRNSDGGIIGVISAMNLRREQETADLLECVMFSFTMAINNLQSFSKVEEVGKKDYLTKLQNRSSYQQALEQHEKSDDDTLACVYVDADGLHQVNNSYGHEAGDNLLKTVADIFSSIFGRSNSYRIGGDEFLAFCSGSSQDEVAKSVSELKRHVEAHGYHVSVGESYRSETPLVYEMVRQAEKMMFQAKRRYYERRKEEAHVRELNWQLEESLKEKRDLEVFCSVLSEKYFGVYIVDLALDTMRSVFIPQYFKENMKSVGGKFSAALLLYAEAMVAHDYIALFNRLTSFGYVQEQLEENNVIEFEYERNDGIRLHLKICPSQFYSEDNRQTIWLFEKV